MEYTLAQRNNAIVAFMGGPTFLKQVIVGREEEILITSPEDLEFHTNWNWIMPVWKKLRRDLIDSPTQGNSIFGLVKAMDEADLKTFHNLVANLCVAWCIRKQIKL